MIRNNKTKKSMMVTALETLFILTLLVAFIDTRWFSPDVVGLTQRLILPGILLAIRLFYAIPDIIIALGTSIEFLDSIGVNGLPAVALILLVVVGVLNYSTTDRVWAEYLKIIASFTTGSFAQKAVVSMPRKRSKHEAAN